jgi:hypothetical protein
MAAALSRTALAEGHAAPLTQPSQIGERLSACWMPPRSEPPEPIEVTVRVSFSRSGAIIGEPRAVYIHGPAGLKAGIAASALAAVKACTPLPFAPALGAAIAGRVFAIRFRSLPVSGKQRAV